MAKKSKKTANFYMNGTNYKISSDHFIVPSMQAEVDKISNFVKDRGGSCRNFHTREYQMRGMYDGYHNALRFESEFFVEGILIKLSGNSLQESRFYVNPFRRDLHRDLTSGRGVILSAFDEYEDYDRRRRLGLVEQEPKMEDAGKLFLSLEGAVRHLARDAPRFYAVTGLPKAWSLPLQLKAYEKK
jgi:hypothetical protein